MQRQRGLADLARYRAGQRAGASLRACCRGCRSRRWIIQPCNRGVALRIYEDRATDAASFRREADEEIGIQALSQLSFMLF